MTRTLHPALGQSSVWLTLLALTACVGTGADAPPPGQAGATTSSAAGAVPAEAFPEGVLRAHVWHCTDGQRFVMRNLLPERAITLALADGEHRLEQTVSASGVRYADAGEAIVFWTKGNSATLARTGAAAVPCDERRAESLREDARLRGVTYRALGNEPGWILEIGPQTKFEWVTNFGTERHAFTESTATVTPDGISYLAGQGSNSIKATIRAGHCVDDGDVVFEYTALVEFRGTLHRGCATKLSAP